MNIDEIVQECQNGNLASFGKIYDEYIRKIYDFVYYKTHHKETAEDIVSKVFIKALSNIKTVDLKKASFKTWLYTIARNTVIDYYRTKKFDRDIEDIWDLAGRDDVARDIDIRNKIKNVQEYLVELKSEQRDIIVMRVWQGMSHKEIAEVMNKSEASCKMMYGRAIKKLRKEMPLALFISLFFV
jgi:RNA polymerase sigma-70 factor, ECF subfamily